MFPGCVASKTQYITNSLKHNKRFMELNSEYDEPPTHKRKVRSIVNGL